MLLRSRRLPGAVHEATDAVVQQALAIATGKPVIATDGSPLVIGADTICLHGDTPGAVEHARAIREAFASHGIRISAVRELRG